MTRNNGYGIRMLLVMIVGMVWGGLSAYGQDNGTVVHPSGDKQYYWIAYSPDGRNIVTTSDDGRIQIWDAATNEVVKVFDSVTTIGFNSAEYSPDGTQIVATGHYEEDEETGTRVPLVQVFDAATGAEIHRLKRHPVGTVRAYYTKDGKKIYSSGYGSDQYLCVWDAETGGLLNAWMIDKFQNKFTLSPDEKFIALVRPLGGRSNAVRIIDATTGDSLSEFLYDTLAPTSFPWTSDGRYLIVSLAISGLYPDKMPIQVVDVATHEVVRTFAGHVQGVIDLSLSDDGKYLASCGKDHTIRVWDVNTGQEVYELPSVGDVLQVRFSPDGRSIAAIGYKNSLIWTLPHPSSTPTTGDLASDMDVICRPNPTTSSTDVLFRLNRPAQVRVSVLDSRGRVVITGIDRTMDAGDHAIPIDVSDLPSGAFFCLVQIEEKLIVRPLQVMR